jgi:hypothetical protein
MQGIRRNAPRLIFGEQLGRRLPARLILEIAIGERLTVVVAHDKADWLLLDRSGRRQAACRQCSPCLTSHNPLVTR